MLNYDTKQNTIFFYLIFSFHLSSSRSLDRICMAHHETSIVKFNVIFLCSLSRWRNWWGFCTQKIFALLCLRFFFNKLFFVWCHTQQFFKITYEENLLFNYICSVIELRKLNINAWKNFYSSQNNFFFLLKTFIILIKSIWIITLDQ